MNKVSIILPCYNLEKTIYKSVECLIKQTYKNIEIIVIDDLGSDNSINIIKSFNDDRIRIIKNEVNSGVGISKQKGIENSTGDYICFADGDDLYELDYIETMLNEAILSDADVVSCGLKIIDTNEIITYRSKIITDKIGVNKLPYLFCKIHTCNKLFKRSVWDNIKYSHRRCVDDTPSLYFAFDNSEKIVFIPYVGFNYYQNPSGLCNSTKRNDGKFEVYQLLSAIDIALYSINKYGFNNSLNHLDIVKYRLSNIANVNRNNFLDEFKEIDSFIDNYLYYRNFKVVYVLVSTYNDTFVQQIFASILSVKQFNPNLEISVFVDKDTNETLIGERSLKDISNVIVVDVPEKYDNGTLKSRYIKTHIRNLIDGDILLLDTDTICLNKINIPIFKNHIGMVKEANQDYVLLSLPFVPQFNYLGYRNNYITNYFNGGVMFLKDTKLCRLFFNDWFLLWDNCVNKDKSLCKDQPPLYFTNTRYNIIDALPKPINYQIYAIGNTKIDINNVSILHVYGNGIGNNHIYFRIIDDIFKERKIDFEKIKMIK